GAGAVAAGTEPSAGTAATGCGTASSATAVVGADAEAGGAACSLPHSIHSRTATISQARIRNTRVWFIRAGRLSRREGPARNRREKRKEEAPALCRRGPGPAMRRPCAAGSGTPAGAARCRQIGRAVVEGQEQDSGA